MPCSQEDMFYKEKVMNIVEVVHHLKNSRFPELARYFENEISDLLSAFDPKVCSLASKLKSIS